MYRVTEYETLNEVPKPHYCRDQVVSNAEGDHVRAWTTREDLENADYPETHANWLGIVQACEEARAAGVEPSSILCVPPQQHTMQGAPWCVVHYHLPPSALPADLQARVPDVGGEWLVLVDGAAPPVGQVIGNLPTGEGVWLTEPDPDHDGQYLGWVIVSDRPPEIEQFES